MEFRIEMLGWIIPTVGISLLVVMYVLYSLFKKEELDENNICKKCGAAMPKGQVASFCSSECANTHYWGYGIREDSENLNNANNLK